MGPLNVGVSFKGESPRHRRAVPAREIAAGDRFMRRSGTPSAPVKSARVVRDSFGTDAYVEAVLSDGTKVTIAIASSIRVYTDRAAPQGFSDLLAIPLEPGSTQAALVAAAQEHRDDAELTQVALRLVQGINLRAGAHLDDLAFAAERLVVEHDDAASAAPLLAVLAELAYDGNEGRWRPTRAGLALAAWQADIGGDAETAQALGAKVREGEDEAASELPGAAATMRRREYTHPILEEREIQRAFESGNAQAEHSLRLARLRQLLALRAHGGSGIPQADLDRLIRGELTALRR